MAEDSITQLDKAAEELHKHSKKFDEMLDGKDKTIQKAVNIALEARKNAKTFRSSVGIAMEMYDGTIFSGFNIETYANKGYHAEEVATINALSAGYHGTDFKRMIEVFQDAGHDEAEIFPGCPLHCWGTLLEFTHPYLKIVVADVTGNVRYQIRLKDIFNTDKGFDIYPSAKIREVKPKLNISPKLPLASELIPFYKSDKKFADYCDKILKVSHK